MSVRPLYLYEIAHIIVTDKVGTAGLLKGMGFGVSEDMNSEELFRVVLENKQNEDMKLQIHKMYDRNPLNQHCTSCFDTVRPLHDVGIKINDELKAKSA